MPTPQAVAALCVDGIDIYMEGEGPHTIVMVHGWPDDYRLWDTTVNGLKHQYRCVRFSLPGFDLSKPSRAQSLAGIAASIARVVEATSPHEPVTFLLHDWGCTFGYEYAARHPDQVARIVSVDIGDHNNGAYLRSLSSKAKRAIFVYQFWLASAWYAGAHISAGLGNAMTRWMARRIGCPGTDSDLHWQKNYPYAMLWMQLQGGLRGCIRVNPVCPVLFIYAKRKAYMFHSPQWLLKLSNTPGCKVAPFATGHWVMLEQPTEFVACVASWLQAHQPD